MRQEATRRIQAIVAGIAVLFGIATLFAGGRVLLGSDPGYQVFRPLLLYNASMGMVYVGTGIALWRRIRAGRAAAGGIFLLNLLVFVAIILLYRSGEGVAIDSVQAMTVRTTVWLGLFVSASWLVRRQAAT